MSPVSPVFHYNNNNNNNNNSNNNNLFLLSTERTFMNEKKWVRLVSQNACHT